MTPDAEDIVAKAKAHVAYWEGQTRRIPTEGDDLRRMCYALVRAVEALGEIRTQAIAEESIHIERLARECLASLGQKP